MNRSAALALLVLLLVGGSTHAASNVDPANDGSKYAWSENLGWLNAKPGGNAGPGVSVDDFELTGWAWSENAGWISLSCKNASTCGTKPYGVTNDGLGRLAGYAWGENIGWINFAPVGNGVTVNPSTGAFAGFAWSENAGWIHFSGSAYKTATAWRCDPTLARPTQSPSLSLGKSSGQAVLSWTTVPLATGYDVVRGGLQALRSSGGSFGASTLGCVANNSTLGSASESSAPAPGDGLWYLVRGANCGGSGTFDTGQPSQIRSRDAGIAGSGNDCNYGPGIVYDNASGSGDLVATIGSPTVSYSHGMGAGLFRGALVVFISGKQSPGAPAGNCRASAVTFGGAPLSSAGFGTATDSSDFKTVVEAWYVVNPPSGSNAIQMTFPSGCPLIQSDAVSLWNVDPSLPIRGTAVSTITATQACAVTTTVTPTTLGWAIDAFAYNRSNDSSPQFAQQIARVERHTANGSVESSSRALNAAPMQLGWSLPGGATCSRAVHLVVAVGPP